MPIAVQPTTPDFVAEVGDVDLDRRVQQVNEAGPDREQQERPGRDAARRFGVDGGDRESALLVERDRRPDRAPRGRATPA